MRARESIGIILVVLGLCAPFPSRADVYQEPEAFIAEIFGSSASPKVRQP